MGRRGFGMKWDSGTIDVWAGFVGDLVRKDVPLSERSSPTPMLTDRSD